MVNHFILGEMEAEYDDLIPCPWCLDHHGIIKKNLERHYLILKKQRNPCVKDLRNCKYNMHHKIHKNALEKHIIECEDAQHFLEEDTNFPVSSFSQDVTGKASSYAVQYPDSCAEMLWDEPHASEDTVPCQDREKSDMPTADEPMGTNQCDVIKLIRRFEKKLKEIASLERKGNLTKEEKDKIAKKSDWAKELEELKTSRDQIYP